MNNHTTARIGKTIRVVLNNGRTFEDKLTDIKSKYYEFENEGRIFRVDVRSFSLRRLKVK